MTRSLSQHARRLPLAAVTLALALAAAGCGGRPADPPAAPAAAPATTVPPSTAPPAAAPALDPATTTPAAVSTTPATSTPAAASTAPAATGARPVPPRHPAVHFDTPQAAMRYLAAAYNRNDQAALRRVTTVRARAALLALRSEAVNLRLLSCSRNPSGDYTCRFQHDFPAHRHLTGHGHATFTAAPAAKPGWYMTVLVDCD